METKIYITMGAKYEENVPIILGVFKTLENAVQCKENMKTGDRYYHRNNWYYWIQTDYLFE